MTRGRKKTRSREEFIAAAIELADADGLDALTLKALGQRLGIAHTTIYRYFRDKDELVVAMRQEILREALLHQDVPISARDRLLTSARTFRRAMRDHPSLIGTMLANTNPFEDTNPVTLLLIDSLEAMGLRGRDLTIAYQQLESFVIGATVYDLSGAPHHLNSRAERLHRVKHPDFDDISRNSASVEVHNEEAFEATLNLLVGDLARRSINASAQNAR